MAEETSIPSQKPISSRKMKTSSTILPGMKLLLFLIPILVSILYKIENSSLKQEIGKIKSLGTSESNSVLLIIPIKYNL